MNNNHKQAMAVILAALMGAFTLCGCSNVGQGNPQIQNVSQAKDTTRSASAQDFISKADKVEVFFKPSTGRNLDPARTDPAAAVLTAKSAIKAFSGDLNLKRKPPCNCDHFEMMRFSRGTEVLIVSFCSSCFDVENHDLFADTHFEMPTHLWERISKFRPEEEDSDK